MKLRSIALAGVALAALSVPAVASEYTGWYLGAGIGYADPMLVHVNSAGLPADQKLWFNSDAMGVVALGYKWDENIRTELELGYSGHSTSQHLGRPLGDLHGGNTTKGLLLNLVYDLPLWHGLTLSAGGGIGLGAVTMEPKLANDSRLIYGQRTGFMWQGIAGLSVALSDSVDLYADWRYRSAEVDDDFHSDLPGFDPVHVDDVTENVALLGIRWYLEPPPPPPPAAAPPPPRPPPPPPPPPPVKTFIVFFDFDKSNLTEKAQEVVAEAVKTAKSQGMVKVMVTGHTDTVGSDTYNQALSERRAQAVKDEMVREGMDGSTIAIEGKSFHDPLVPTGPGVREPQNRRAVIDLGG